MENKKKETKQKNKSNKIVTGDSNIAEVVFTYPEAAEVLQAFGLHCTTCFASQFDTVYEGAKLHGMHDDEIQEMIDEANKVINGETDE